MILLQVNLTDGLSWPSISFAIFIIALLLSAYVLWRRYLSRQMLVQRVKELETLSEVGRAIVAAELDVEALCELIANEAGKVIDASTFQAGIFEESLYHILYWRINGRNQNTPATFDLSENSGIVGWVRDTHRPLLIHDFQRELNNLPAVPRYISDTPPRSAIFLPLISGEEVIGIVAAQHRQPNRFREEDLRRLMILANQAAAAIAHAQLYAEERKRVAQLTLVGKIARQINNISELEEIFQQVVSLTHETFGFHPVSIFLCDERHLVMQASSDRRLPDLSATLPVEDGLVGTAVSTKKTIISNNTQVDSRFLSILPGLPQTSNGSIQAEIAIPLITDSEVMGVLDVQSEQRGAFTPTDQATLETLAAEVAVAIQKARQFSRQQEQAWMTTARLQIAEATSRSTDLDELVTVVCRLTPILIGTPFCTILLWDAEAEQYDLAAWYAEHKPGWELKPVTLSIGDWPTLDAVHVGQESLYTPNLPPWLHPLMPPDVNEIILIPMATAAQPNGVLITSKLKPNATHTLINRRSHQRREELLHSIASQTAQAVESAQLRIAQQEEAWVNTALLQVAEAVNNLIDLNEILGTIVRLVPMLVGVHSTIIFIWDEKQNVFHAGPSYGVSQMGRGLLETLAIDMEEMEALLPKLGDAETSTGTNFLLKLPHWLKRAFGTNQAIVFPLHARGKLVGLIAIGMFSTDGRLLTARRRNILNGIAHQAATAVVNNHLYKESAERTRLAQELSVAHNIQASLIPPGNPHIHGCSVASYWRAARQVGGDFYDFIPLEDKKWGIVIADVADKGIPAALFMAMSRTIIRTIAYNRVHPSETLIRVNQIIDSEAQSDLFVTVFYAVFDSQKLTLTYANGGHNPPLLLHANGEVELLRGDGIALGILPDITIIESSVHLLPGDTIIFYTDGVTEAMNEDFDEFGIGRLQLIAQQRRHQSADHIMRAITHAVNVHAGETPQFDDITMVVLKIDP